MVFGNRGRLGGALSGARGSGSIRGGIDDSFGCCWESSGTGDEWMVILWIVTIGDDDDDDGENKWRHF